MRKNYSENSLRISNSLECERIIILDKLCSRHYILYESLKNKDQLETRDNS